jgi:hypothetical protein
MNLLSAAIVIITYYRYNQVAATIVLYAYTVFTWIIFLEIARPTVGEPWNQSRFITTRKRVIWFGIAAVRVGMSL